MPLICSDLSHFPPFLVQGHGLKYIVIRAWLTYAEFINMMLSLIIIFNVFFLCVKDGWQWQVMIDVNYAITLYITAEALFIKLLLISPLYFNKNYYGSLFICFDVISGPFSLLLLILSENFAWLLPVANICIMMRVNCLQKIRIIILDVIYIVSKIKGLILAIL